MKNIIAERVVHDGKSRVALRFPYDPKVYSGVTGAQEQQDHRDLHSCDDKEYSEDQESF